MTEQGIQAAKRYTGFDEKLHTTLNEDIEKAGHSAGFLFNDLHSARLRACKENRALAILLLDLIRDAVKIKQRIEEIQSFL